MNKTNIIILAGGSFKKHDPQRHLMTGRGKKNWGEPLIDLVIKRSIVDDTNLYVVIDGENHELREHVSNISSVRILTPEKRSIPSSFEIAFSIQGDCIIVAGDLINLRDGDVKRFVDSEHECAIMKYKIPWGPNMTCSHSSKSLIKRGDIGCSVFKISQKYKSDFLSKENLSNATEYQKIFKGGLYESWLWTWMVFAFFRKIYTNPNCDSFGEKGVVFFEHKTYLDND